MKPAALLISPDSPAGIASQCSATGTISEGQICIRHRSPARYIQHESVQPEHPKQRENLVDFAIRPRRFSPNSLTRSDSCVRESLPTSRNLLSEPARRQFGRMVTKPGHKRVASEDQLEARAVRWKLRRCRTGGRQVYAVSVDRSPFENAAGALNVSKAVRRFAGTADVRGENLLMNAAAGGGFRQQAIGWFGLFDVFRSCGRFRQHAQPVCLEPCSTDPPHREARSG